MTFVSFLVFKDLFIFLLQKVTNVTFINKNDAIFASMKISSIIFPIVLTTLVLFSSLRVTVIFAYYELDPIGFIEKLCENKDKPELQCNGKCHLKKVAESNSENQQEPAKSTTIKDITLFVINKLEYNLSKTIKTENKNFTYNNLYAFSSIYQIDRPPQV